MDTSCITNAFNICWLALLDESNRFNGKFFEARNCRGISITGNLDTIEHRLAYMYKYGYIKIMLAEKCISTFLKEHPGAQSIYLSEKLQICTLNHGPGIELVGFLLALMKSDKQSNCLPILKSINVFDSWRNIFEQVTTAAYRGYLSKGNFNEPINIFDNIQFIHCNLFLKLSSEAQECIRSSDILSMFWPFNYSKATPDVVTHVLQKIFVLLKPGALVFFVGTKKNLKVIGGLKSLVHCIFNSGKKKLTAGILPINEDIVRVVGITPLLSKTARFIVLKRVVSGVLDQKMICCTSEISKNEIEGIASIKAESVSIPCMSDSLAVWEDLGEEDSDANTDISVSSCKQSEVLSVESKNISCEDILDAQFPTFSKEKNVRNSVNINTQLMNLSPENTFQTVENVTHRTESIDLGNSKTEKKVNVQDNLYKLFLQIVSGPEKNILMKEAEPSGIQEPVLSQTPNAIDHCTENISKYSSREDILVKISQDNMSEHGNEVLFLDNMNKKHSTSERNSLTEDICMSTSSLHDKNVKNVSNEEQPEDTNKQLQQQLESEFQNINSVTSFDYETCAINKCKEQIMSRKTSQETLKYFNTSSEDLQFLNKSMILNDESITETNNENSPVKSEKVIHLCSADYFTSDKNKDFPSLNENVIFSDESIKETNIKKASVELEHKVYPGIANYLSSATNEAFLPLNKNVTLDGESVKAANNKTTPIKSEKGIHPVCLSSVQNEEFSSLNKSAVLNKKGLKDTNSNKLMKSEKGVDPWITNCLSSVKNEDFPSLNKNMTLNHENVGDANNKIKSVKSEGVHPVVANYLPSAENGRNTKAMKRENSRMVLQENLMQYDNSTSYCETFKVNKNKEDFNSILQHCETLVTSLEQLVSSITPNKQSLVCEQIPSKKCTLKKSYTNFRCPHCACCNNHVHFCGSKMCNCEVRQNNTYSNCAKSVSCRACMNEMQISKCNFAGAAAHKPNIVIPIQNENLSMILNLTLKKS